MLYADDLESTNDDLQDLDPDLDAWLDERAAEILAHLDASHEALNQSAVAL